MPKIEYKSKKFSSNSANLITISNKIIEDYQSQGFVLTIRQLYYQLVAKDIIPNEQKEYDRLSNIISDARRAGLVDWDAIVDRTRNLARNKHYSSPQSALTELSKNYFIDMWKNQENRVEVWVEKDAAIGIIDGVCSRTDMDVPYFSCRGYTSDSELWSAGQRILKRASRGRPQRTIILHFGDHDPSGIDMTRDIYDRVNLFTFGGGEKLFKVVRLGLNYDQVKRYTPPPNPAKKTDARFKKYAEKYGGSSWELDALAPNVVAGLITHAVNTLKDDKQWEEDRLRWLKEKEKLKELVKTL